MALHFVYFNRSLHLSDFKSQEILNDEDLLVKKTATIATSPIKFEKNCDSPRITSINNDLVKSPIGAMQMPINPDPFLPPPNQVFTGFGFASGKKVIAETSKAASLFSDIFEEFDLKPISAPVNFGGFQTAKVSGPSTKLEEVKQTHVFSTVSLPQLTSGFTTCAKINSLPVELQNFSFDDDLSVDILNHISNVEKIALQKSSLSKTNVSPLKAVENLNEIKLRPKRVEQLRSPQVKTSPLIESPEGFMSGLINREISAASTPLNRRDPLVNSRNMNVRRTKLLNRMSEGISSPPKGISGHESGRSSFYEEMTVEMKEMRKKSYLEQVQTIESKSVEMKIAVPGSLFVRKGQENRMKWKDFVKEEIVKKEMLFKSVTTSITQVTQGEINFRNAKNFRFNLLQFCR